jgi:dihydroorotase
VIDPHVHLRDWAQRRKETLRHGLSVAWRAGLDGVFEMPNTDPPLTNRQAIQRRIAEADDAVADLGVEIFHGLYAGLTPDPEQIAEAVDAWRSLFPRVVGLKMFAGHSTGNMGIVGRDRQAAVYGRLAALGFTGVLAVHAEKEELFPPAPEGPPARVPASGHARGRPPESEVESVRDQIECARAAGFRGTLHVVHVSVPAALDLITAARAGGMAVTAGLTPHHALLSAEAMDAPGGALLKTNPPLRFAPLPAVMIERLFGGEVDWIETDHAPHTLEEKQEGRASGIPGLPFYPRFIRFLERRGMPQGRLRSLTHDAIARTFRIDLPDTRRRPEPGLVEELAAEYPFDPFAGLRG